MQGFFWNTCFFKRTPVIVFKVCSELAVAESSAQTKVLNLNDMVARLENVLIVQLKTALASLLLFTASDMTFSSLDPCTAFHISYINLPNIDRTFFLSVTEFVLFLAQILIVYAEDLLFLNKFRETKGLKLFRISYRQKRV